jgi:antitoxin component YwqK of YwqJK toxin-antitoxin module
MLEAYTREMASDMPIKTYKERLKMRKSAILLAIAIMIVNSTAYAEVVKNYYPSGELLSEENVKDGKTEGIRKTYYKSGELLAEGTIKDGKPEGITKWYYKSGQLEQEMNFKDGKRHGTSKQYYPNGKIKRIYTYRNGIEINQKNYAE